MGVVYFVMAIVALFAFSALEWVLDNILWLGSITILLFVVSIIRAFPDYIADYKDFGFDFNDFMILLLKLGGIAFIVFLMCL